jgi:hypothetical protein
MIKLEGYLAIFSIYICICWLVILTFSNIYAYELPLYEGISVKIEGIITENYSNNVTFAHDDKDKKEQFTTMLTFGLDLNYEGKRKTLGLTGQINYPLRLKSSDVRNSSEMLTLSFLDEVTKYDRVYINNTFTHTQVPGSFEEDSDYEECEKLFEEFGLDAVRNDPRCAKFEEEFGRDQGKFDAYTNNLNINYSKTINDKIKFTAGYGNSINKTSKETSDDSVLDKYRISVSYSPSYNSSFSLSYSFSDTRYEEGDSISINSIKAGIKKYITKRLLFNGDIGMVYTPSTDTTSFDVIFTSEVDEKTNANISFSRDIRAATDREDVFRSWRVTGRLMITLLKDLNSSISGFYGQGKFVSEGETDTLVGGTILLRYTFWKHKRGPRLFGSLGYTYSELDSTDEEKGYDRSSINSRLTIAF